MKDEFINIGKPSFDKRKIPVLIDKGVFINEKVNIKNNQYIISCITINNPYVIVLNKKINDINLDNMAYEVGSYFIFPERVNIIFSEYNNNVIKNVIYGENNIYDSVCASVVAQTLYNRLNKNDELIVYEDNKIYSVIYNENVFLKIIDMNNGKKLVK